MATEAQAQTGQESVTVAVQGKTLPEDKNEARKKAFGLLKQNKAKEEKTVKSGVPTPKLVGHLLKQLKGNTDPVLQEEIETVLKAFDITEPQKKQIMEDIQNNPNAFGMESPKSLKQLGLPPEQVKSAGFFRPPSSKAELESVYYPRRFASAPSEDWFEEGTLIYHVYEDDTFFALHPDQQTPEAQAAITLPTCNLYSPVGEVEGVTDQQDDKPKKAKK